MEIEEKERENAKMRKETGNESRAKTGVVAVACFAGFRDKCLLAGWKKARLKRRLLKKRKTGRIR